MVQWKKFEEMNLKQFLCISICCLTLTGCSSLGNVSELLTLKKFAEHQDGTDQYVEEQNLKFKKLLEQVVNNQLASYPDKQSIVDEFGDPIYVKQISKNDQISIN